jgi:cbb3-type cytochrome oxidase subunit 3
MKSEALATFHHIGLTCLGLVLFFVVFVGALFWVFRPRTKELYSYTEKIPFQGD